MNYIESLQMIREQGDNFIKDAPFKVILPSETTYSKDIIIQINSKDDLILAKDAMTGGYFLGVVYNDREIIRNSDI